MHKEQVLVSGVGRPKIEVHTRAVSMYPPRLKRGIEGLQQSIKLKIDCPERAPNTQIYPKESDDFYIPSRPRLSVRTRKPEGGRIIRVDVGGEGHREGDREGHRLGDRSGHREVNERVLTLDNPMRKYNTRRHIRPLMPIPIWIPPGEVRVNSNILSGSWKLSPQIQETIRRSREGGSESSSRESSQQSAGRISKLYAGRFPPQHIPPPQPLYIHPQQPTVNRISPTFKLPLNTPHDTLGEFGTINTPPARKLITNRFTNTSPRAAEHQLATSQILSHRRILATPRDPTFPPLIDNSHDIHSTEFDRNQISFEGNLAALCNNLDNDYLNYNHILKNLNKLTNQDHLKVLKSLKIKRDQKVRENERLMLKVQKQNEEKEYKFQLLTYLKKLEIENKELVKDIAQNNYKSTESSLTQESGSKVGHTLHKQDALQLQVNKTKTKINKLKGQAELVSRKNKILKNRWEIVHKKMKKGQTENIQMFRDIGFLKKEEEELCEKQTTIEDIFEDKYALFQKSLIALEGTVGPQ